MSKNMYAGKNNYISGISSDKKTKVIQLWQFLGCKILFRLSLLSHNQTICDICGNHTKYPYEIKCKMKKTTKYNLSEYPIFDIVHDGYTYNYYNLKGKYKYVF